MLARQIQQPVREIVYRTRGRTHGPITRLMSPGDVGELLKPFVFLDLFVIFLDLFVMDGHRVLASRPDNGEATAMTSQSSFAY